MTGGRAGAGRGGGIIAVLIASVLWGTTGTAATFAPGAGPLAIGAAALGIGGLLQGLIALPELRRERSALRGHAGVVVAGALAVAVYPLAFYSSMHLAGVAIGTVVSLGSAPIASGLLERALEGRRLGGRWILAAALGIAGSAVLCVSKMRDPANAPAETVLGIGLGLVAGISYALYSWCAYRLILGGAGRATAMGAVLGLGGALLIPVLIAIGAPLVESPRNLAVAAYMALVPMFLGYLLFGVGLTRIAPSTATTLTLSEPAVAAVLAVAVVGERLGTAGWVGLGLIATALAILSLPQRGPSRGGRTGTGRRTP